VVRKRNQAGRAGEGLRAAATAGNTGQLQTIRAGEYLFEWVKPRVQNARDRTRFSSSEVMLDAS
jgi:hypothetical protein